MPDPPNLDADKQRAIHRIREVGSLEREELDALPYGVIEVDLEGIVLAYNETEAKLAGKNAADVIGKNFFEDVAPCTNVEKFAKRFHAGIARGELSETFPFLFAFDSGPVHVMVTLHHDTGAESAWILVDMFEGS